MALGAFVTAMDKRFRRDPQRRRPHETSRWLPLAIFLALGPLAAGVWMSRNPDREALPAADRQARAGFQPAFAARTQPSVTLRQLRGSFVLNVWASWCVECRVEHRCQTSPKPARARDRLRLAGRTRRRAALAGAVRQPFWVVVADADGKAAIDWGVYGAPETSSSIATASSAGSVGPTDAIVADELLPALQRGGFADFRKAESSQRKTDSRFRGMTAKFCARRFWTPRFRDIGLRATGRTDAPLQFRDAIEETLPRARLGLRCVMPEPVAGRFQREDRGRPARRNPATDAPRASDAQIEQFLVARYGNSCCTTADRRRTCCCGSGRRWCCWPVARWSPASCAGVRARRFPTTIAGSGDAAFLALAAALVAVTLACVLAPLWRGRGAFMASRSRCSSPAPPSACTRCSARRPRSTRHCAKRHGPSTTRSRGCGRIAARSRRSPMAGACSAALADQGKAVESREAFARGDATPGRSGRARRNREARAKTDPDTASTRRR